MGYSGNRILRGLLGVVMLLGFLWFLFVCISANHHPVFTTVTVPSRSNSKLLKFIESERNHHGVHRDYGLNYVSKRRVPNGPDPIHNRLAGKYRRPPGRA